MSSVVNADIEAKGGFSANRWTKDGERGLADQCMLMHREGQGRLLRPC